MTGRRPIGRVGLVVTLLGTTAALVLFSPVASLASPTQECPSTTILDDPCTPTTTEPLPTTATTLQATSTSRPTTTTTRKTAATTPQPTTSTTAPPPARDLLVPGDGTSGAEDTTTTEPTAQTISSNGPSDGTLITLIVVGLGVIACVMGTLTWRYWSATQSPPDDPLPPGSRPAR